MFRQPAPGTALTTIRQATGSDNSGSFYSFGVAGVNLVVERALGGIGSGGAYYGNPPGVTPVAGWIAVGLTNATANAFNSFTIAYDGEQWRNGGDGNPAVAPDAVAQTMVVEYGFGATFETVSAWTAAGSAFDFASPTVAQTASTLDGNAAANRAADLGGTVTATWAASDTLWIRWIERDDANNDHGLAIDNFELSVGAPPTNDADYNNDGDVDNDDLAVWTGAFGVSGAGTADADTDTDGTDFLIWQKTYTGPLPGTGAVPEPGSAVLAVLGLLWAGGRGRLRA